ncbi:MAG TPA: multidrug effflux MFS transporter [Flavisolibacter sp.]|nr:multidrug effflux MFS transporter [Flavisolibacter sp.]
MKNAPTPPLAGSRRFTVILLLGLLSAIGPFSIDMYLPGFPAIAADLHTSVDAVSYSLSSFFAGICIGQLACGPLLDRFGRKKPLYTGLVLYVLSSIGCALATSIEVLIVFRLLQAFGGCVGMVAPRAIVRDLFPLRENAKIFSLLILVLGVSPIIAPTAGSYIIAHFGWHTVFGVLTVMGLLILIAVIFLLPESKQPDPNFSLRPPVILRSFASVMREPQFYTYALSGGIVSAGLFAYLSGSPFVFMELYGLSEQEYGWIFALIAAGLIASSQLNNLLLKKWSSEKIIMVTLWLQTAVGLVFVAGTVLGLFGLTGAIICIFIFLSCQGFSFPNSSALSMAPFTKEAGSASALMGAMQMALGAMASAAVGLLNNGTAVPLAGVMASCAVGALLVLFLGRRQIRYRARKAELEVQKLELMERV